MKKLGYLGLMIELTRRCNLACQHCMRGDPQDVTISREVIDRIVENIEECGYIAFTGGEPLLAMDELDYLVDRINEAGIKVKHHKTGEREIKAGGLAQCDPNWSVADYWTAIFEAEQVRIIGDIISASFKMPEFMLSERTRRR